MKTGICCEPGDIVVEQSREEPDVQYFYLVLAPYDAYDNNKSHDWYEVTCVFSHKLDYPILDRVYQTYFLNNTSWKYYKL